MADIKVKDIAKNGIKTLNKSIVVGQKLKDNIVEVKEKANNVTKKENNINEYGSDKINNITAFPVDKSLKDFNKGEKAFVRTKDNLQKSKLKIKEFNKKRLAKKSAKKTVKSSKKAIKTSKEVTKKTQKAVKESIKASKRAMQLAKRTAQGIKVAIKVTISTIKAIIATTKAIISAIAAGGWVAVIVIIVMCLVGLLVGSIFGIFFSSEQINPNSITMKEVIAECNQEFSDKIQTIQNQNPHDDYVLDGNMASWKDILTIYAVKVSNGNNQQEVITMDNSKKAIVKQIFWDMNNLSSEVKIETVIEKGVNTDELPKKVEKKVLHITITSKSAEQMKIIYYFNSLQLKQYEELSSNKYDSLWSSVIYGFNDKGEYVNWRQDSQSWSNIKIGNTSGTIESIGCLVTSVAILIAKSGVNTDISPFNPGTFVEKLNENGGFNEKGELKYDSINKVVPNFKYIGKVNLREKTREEKLLLINQYLSQGYYLTIEVKGATQGNQHWVAIMSINGNNVNMIDPAKDNTDLWNTYEWSKSSQFNYFKAN